MIWREADFDHGRIQVTRLVNDRPQLTRFINDDGENNFKNWLVGQFAGESTGFRIYWDNAKLFQAAYGVPAENNGPSPNQNAAIRIADDILKAEEVFELLVFELLNLTQFPRVRELKSKAKQQQLTKAEFVQELFYVEHDAAQLLQRYYLEHFLPWAIQHKFASDPNLWFLEHQCWWKPSSESISDYSFSDPYPWQVYGAFYDRLRREAYIERTQFQPGE